MSGLNSVNDRLQDAVEDDKYEGLMIGYVVENNDPDGIARVKVKVTNVLDTDQGPVPWCLPSKHSPFGQGPGYGVYGSPAVGSPVRVRFQNGDPNYPIYEADEYLKAHANPKFQNPKTWGYKDPGGSELWVNYETGAWEFVHQSGLFVKYDSAGNLTQYVPGNESETIDGSSTITIGNFLFIDVATDVTIKASGNIRLDTPGVATTGNLSVGTGATGTFGTTTGQTVTVTDGIITNIT